ncbi:hypothetical protein FF38_05397 [Lucilia cuprina]|uniref:Uncharacterized protein n=1 Tax=Lucilia cuprina TaxID=7375 RepID=A0A0L0C417_LUCCU|nr:hypothetical protein FF38_05397 [Lucilia cuprina]
METSKLFEHLGPPAAEEGGVSSHLCISIADDVRELKIEVISVRLPNNPVPLLRLVDERLLVGCVTQGETLAGSSEALRQIKTNQPPSPTHLLEGNAATDSRRERPNIVAGTLDIVTTECRLPDGAGACESVARKAASLGDGPEPSPPRSERRLT